MSDPTPPCVRRGMAVRVPPRGHRVLTYPRPPRPRRRVSTVCVPPIWHRVMSDPTPPCARRGLAVRVPPRGHRVLTYPRPFRPGRRVSIVCVPWRTPPSPGRSARAGCARKACPTPLPIPAPAPHSSAHQNTAHTRTDYSRAALSPCIAGGPQGGQPLLPSPHGGEGPGDGPKPHHTWHYPCGFGPSWLRPGAPSPGACSGGGLGRGRRLAHPTTHQVHPAIQVPPHPRPCSTADTGFSRQHPSRAPPASRPPLWREPPSSSTIE